MMSRAAKFVILSTLAAAAGCIAPGDDAPVVAAERGIELPDVKVYERGQVDGATLVPAGVSYIHLAFTPGPDTRSAYAWGIAGDRVLYIFLVSTGEDDDDLARRFHLTADEREAIGAVRGHSIAGTAHTGGPKPPTPPGEPEFSQAYATAVLEAARSTQAATEQMIGAISDL